MQKIEFDGMQRLRSIIAAALPAASTDDERPDIYGVGLEVIAGEVRALATNGQWAMRIKYAPSYADDGFKLLIPYPWVIRLLALIGDGIGQARITRDDTLVRFDLERIGRLDLNVDGIAEVHLPRIEDLWPTDEPKRTDEIGLNPSLMTRVAKAFKEVAEKPTLRFAFHGMGPIVITCEEEPNADALLMPCILNDGSEEDENRQEVLFPEPEKPATVAKAVEAFRDAIPEGETVTIKGGGQSVTLNGRSKSKLKPKAAKPKPKAKKAKPKKGK